MILDKFGRFNAWTEIVLLIFATIMKGGAISC
jgi:hypothetical protein